MRNRIFRAIVIWSDGENEDADEIQVFASSSEEAGLSALRKWQTSVGVRWPSCQPIEIIVGKQTRYCGGVPSAE